MKNPHDQSEYVKVDQPETAKADDAGESTEQPSAEADTAQTPKKEKKKKAKLSGAYYYVDKDEQRLASMSFARTTLTIIAVLLQLVALLFPEQAGAMYVSKHVASLGLFYVLFTIFGMGCVSIWLMIMNQIRYKIQKRIVAEYAPKNGFKKRAYFGQELYLAVTAIMAAFQLSFVCIKFDGWGLGAFFVCLASLGAAVAARQITHRTLKDAELIQNAE